MENNNRERGSLEGEQKKKISSITEGTITMAFSNSKDRKVRVSH